jgi:hypothetical protein
LPDTSIWIFRQDIVTRGSDSLAINDVKSYEPHTCERYARSRNLKLLKTPVARCLLSQDWPVYFRAALELISRVYHERSQALSYVSYYQLVFRADGQLPRAMDRPI